MSGMDRLTDERHADTERNRILNIALTNLDAIINGHNPDVDTSINNMVWDRLDKLACDVELLAHRRASQAAPALSDGLREAVARRILDDAISSVEDDMRADMEDAEDTGEHVDVGQYEIVLSYETAQTIRAALSASPAQEGEPRHD